MFLFRGQFLCISKIGLNLFVIALDTIFIDHITKRDRPEIFNILGDFHIWNQSNGSFIIHKCWSDRLYQEGGESVFQTLKMF